MEDQLVINSATPLGNGMFYWELDTNQGKFFYTPAEFVNKGAVTDRLWVPEANDYAPVGGIQFFEPGFLKNPDVVKNAKPVLLQDNILTGNVTKLNLFENPNQGILMTPDQAKKVLGKDYDTWVEKREFPWFNQNIASQYFINEKNPNTGQPLGRITGLGVYNGNPVYSRETEGGYTSSFVNPGEKDSAFTVESTFKKCGIFGCSVSDALGDIAQAFGRVPFLTEATAFIPGVGPAIYGALKGTQAGMAGKDPLETAFKVGTSVFLQQQALGGTQSPAPIVDATYAAGAPVIESLTAVPAIETLLSSGLAAPVTDALYSAGSSAIEGLTGTPNLLEPSLGGGITAGTSTGTLLPETVSAGIGGGATGTGLSGAIAGPGLDSVSNLTGLLSPTETVAGAGLGLFSPTVPSSGFMGGGQGIVAEVPGGFVTEAGLTPSTATPVLGDFSSIINQPEVIGQPVIGGGAAPITDISVPFDQAAYDEYAGLSGLGKGAGSLLEAVGESVMGGLGGGIPTAPAQPTPQQQMMGGGATQRGVDYSSLLALLQGRATVPGLLGVQFRPQPTDLSQLYRSSLLG